MISYPNWDIAPEGATHYDRDCGVFCTSKQWWSSGGGMVYSAPNQDGWGTERYIQREPKPWSGPEDGLPPVGSVCEVENPLEDGQWCKVKILAWDAECAVFQAEADYPYVYDGQGVEGFRPLRTPEQLREAAIRELMDIAQVDCRVTAARLVDAGFKR